MFNWAFLGIWEYCVVCNILAFKCVQCSLPANWTRLVVASGDIKYYYYKHWRRMHRNDSASLISQGGQFQCGVLIHTCGCYTLWCVILYCWVLASQKVVSGCMMGILLVLWASLSHNIAPPFYPSQPHTCHCMIALSRYLLHHKNKMNTNSTGDP